MATQVTAFDTVFDRLLSIPDEADRLRFLSENQMFSRETVEQMGATVRVLVRVDLRKACTLAETALALAAQLGDSESRAWALRSVANSLGFVGENRKAAELHAQAVELFRQAAQPLEVARTLSTSIRSLILLGEYDQALAAAGQAKAIFTEANDALRLARLDINIGNIFHRQDRFCDALDYYRRAVKELLPDKDDEGILAALHNIAVCQIMLNEYEDAEATYQQVRTFCNSRDVPLATAQAEYNIAYLHYLKGAYGRAIDMLRSAREVALKTGDAYHVALCHLDLSEIYLELNLCQDTVELAQRAFKDFQQLGMGYEAAKALCQSAIALSQQGKTFRALQLFDQARTMFIKEKNHIWPALIDLYRALTYFNKGQFVEARWYCLAALDFFRDAPLPGRAILCQLLLAKLLLKKGEIEAARRECEACRRNLAGKDANILWYQIHLVMGQVEELGGNVAAAKEHYRNAKNVLEILRSGLHSEELKISFLENRLEVYENLVYLCVAPEKNARNLSEAWACMEHAKSRSLLELTARRVDGALPASLKENPATLDIVNLREQLNWYYHRIEVEQLAQSPASRERLLDLRRRAEYCEGAFLRAVREVRSDEAETAGSEMPKPVSLDSIRSALPEDVTLVEYFRVREEILAAVVSRNHVDIRTVGNAQRAAESWRLLQFQLSKFYLSPAYVEQFQDQLREAAQSHLRELYLELVAPIRDQLAGRHLIVVPHEFLHHVPFHSLFDGEQYLVDSFSFSYAPSASIYVQCLQKEANAVGPPLVLGVPDPQTPSVYVELQEVATALPDAEVFIGKNATEHVLRVRGRESRLIHIATHGVFRSDSPMFSGIRLGDTFLTLYDLYRLQLPVEHITLSGCSTGLNAIAAGDELLGLARGLLYAGARCLLLSLWDINDKSTAEFMKVFYQQLLKHGDRALAFQTAMLELRERYPHPFFWAPFVLVGHSLAGSRTPHL